ncbi:MAG: hypothetical protein BWX80_02223 [Candidatus Hydrogenedentes bacterium ADurb.Bin101]|nr:MAG: hypothetical protein BWX80_02223 [Candidatus Hydrogenedentes bacterium ADurb.Bin101]
MSGEWRVVGRSFAGGEGGGVAEFGPVAAEAVPGLGDDFVDAFAFGQAVVFGLCAGDLFLGVKETTEQVGWQQAAFGVDGLEVGGVTA